SRARRLEFHRPARAARALPGPRAPSRLSPTVLASFGSASRIARLAGRRGTILQQPGRDDMRQSQFRAPVAVLGALCAFGALAQEGGPRSADGNLETVVVTGKEAGAEERDGVARIPGGASFIDMGSLRERKVATLADALRYVPGVWSASHVGNDRVFFSSRGSNLDATDYDMNGIKLLQDGMPVTTADGHNHNRVVDPLSAARATVARGANALEHGAS